uniref:NudC domain-containing protein 1 n=1 Tax=Stegastes partitus TaxID=144197 RepID=A0A3B4Z7U1_9TELE
VSDALFSPFLNSDPIYFWQQTAEDITVCVRMPEGVTKEEVQFRLTADNVSLGVRGFPPLLEGQLFASVDPEASAWIIKNDKRFADSTDCLWFSLLSTEGGVTGRRRVREELQKETSEGGATGRKLV